MEYALIAFTSIIIIALLWGIYVHIYTGKSVFSKKKKKTVTSPQGPAYAHCPVCSSALPKGMNIYSKVYRPMNVPDQRCTISGCPHCFPQMEPGIRRKCPVCGKDVPVNGYLIARLFNKKDGSKHVHIVFCTECQRGGKK